MRTLLFSEIKKEMPNSAALGAFNDSQNSSSGYNATLTSGSNVSVKDIFNDFVNKDIVPSQMYVSYSQIQKKLLNTTPFNTKKILIRKSGFKILFNQTILLQSENYLKTQSSSLYRNAKFDLQKHTALLRGSFSKTFR